ncbi:hypothetical protein NDU88_007258 [Pleurodeles waltl]|uniref:Uncharacterized protein n=1 Tax=Pleurodeles waltl TaxID=8319 RepID=A0AAV7RRV5_PLEWA|nr:hypothetical protein NDU88_007258 [Pleurodeles waltl]
MRSLLDWRRLDVDSPVYRKTKERNGRSSDFSVLAPSAADAASPDTRSRPIEAVASEDSSDPLSSPSSLFSVPETRKSESQASGAAPTLPWEWQTPTSDAREQRQSEESVGAVEDTRLQSGNMA